MEIMYWTKRQDFTIILENTDGSLHQILQKYDTTGYHEYCDSNEVKINFEVPGEISEVIEKMEKAGFEAWLVGGCVRDLFLGISPKD